uniref:Zinc ribbon domain-containing protein n=1 Tax=candidate division WOR-3 bacterium TaxID=2052148 RepID=A0A7V3V0B7_UNCW3
MPIYEFNCKSCHHTFEELLLSDSEQKDLTCPKCGSRSLSRIFSVFGVAGTEKKVKNTNSSCSHCSSHNCSTCS